MSRSERSTPEGSMKPESEPSDGPPAAQEGGDGESAQENTEERSGPRSRVRLDDLAELLHRAVPIGTVKRDGTVTTSVFRPRDNDGGYLSVHRNSKISAERAYWCRTAMGRRVLGMLSVSVEECGRQPVWQDPTGSDEYGRAHALIDFNGLDRGQQEQLSKRLHELAFRRNWTFKPEG